MYKRRSANIDLLGTLFRKRRNLFRWPVPMVRMKLQLRLSEPSANCFAGEVVLLSAAVKLTNTAPAFFLAENPSSNSWVKGAT